MFRYRFTIAGMIAAVLWALLPATGPVQAAPGERCFDATGQCISGRFREYWERHGGLAVFGYPISAARPERNRDTGAVYLTQWFERNRFELHPQNKAPYDVLLGRLGDDRLRQLGVDWRVEGRGGQGNGCLSFEETGHSVCDQARGLGFRSYWSTHGLEFDGRSGVSYRESLALFGLPLTEPRWEINTSGDRVLTQWFERARFEWHPAQPDPAFRVLLGRLSSEVRDPDTRYRLPTDAPWVYQDDEVVAVSAGTPRFALPRADHNASPPEIRIAPNGKRLAFAERSPEGEAYLVVLSLDSGYRRVFPVAHGAMIFGGMWSPDSRNYLYTAIYGGPQQRYELRVLDAATGAVAVRHSGVGDSVPVALEWKPSGVFLTTVTFGSDAPASDVLQLDPASGRLQTVTRGSHITATISPDGRKIALVTGEYPLGGTPRLALTVLDRATGRRNTIVPQNAGYIGSVQWSPDGAKLLHTRTPVDAPEPAGVFVANADGSGEQMLRLDSGAFPGALEDVAWRSSSAVLLVTRDGPRHLSVFALALSDFHPARASRLQTFGRDSDFWGTVVYVPR